jgi:hypothetical protein
MGSDEDVITLAPELDFTIENESVWWIDEIPRRTAKRADEVKFGMFKTTDDTFLLKRTPFLPSLRPFRCDKYT